MESTHDASLVGWSSFGVSTQTQGLLKGVGLPIRRKLPRLDLNNRAPGNLKANHILVVSKMSYKEVLLGLISCRLIGQACRVLNLSWELERRRVASKVKELERVISLFSVCETWLWIQNDFLRCISKSDTILEPFQTTLKTRTQCSRTSQNNALFLKPTQRTN